MLRDRQLAWEGCLNVRDLGGHPTQDGGETAYGSVVRADSVRQLTDSGWQALVAYGVRTVVDLRGHHECENDPPGDRPVEVAHVPFMEADEREWNEIAAEIERATAALDAVAATREAYLIFLEHFKANAAAAIRAVALAPEGGVVVHCAGGKDRTGLLAAFLLHLAGVSPESIAADYALSEERLGPLHAQAPAEAMRGVLVELERRYGSVEAFLLAAGVSEHELRLARARLRG